MVHNDLKVNIVYKTVNIYGFKFKLDTVENLGFRYQGTHI